MPTPFPFVSGAVLAASNLNSISELPTRTLTGSGAAVAADSYSRVILNGTSITYTINTSTFSAGQVVELYNANSTAATIAAGAGVTLNGAAGLTLAQYQTAELYAVSATSFVLWKSDVTLPAGGLNYLSGASFTAVSSVSFPNSTFTSSYRNYRVLFNVTGASTTLNITARLRTGGSDIATSYFQGSPGWVHTNVASNQADSSATAWSLGSCASSTYPIYNVAIDLFGPQTSQITQMASGNLTCNVSGTGYIGRSLGLFREGASGFTYDALSFITSTGTITGEYRVYGYLNS